MFPILIYNFSENLNISKDTNIILKLSLFLSVLLFIIFVDNYKVKINTREELLYEL